MKRALRIITYVILFPLVALGALLLVGTAAAMSLFEEEAK